MSNRWLILAVLFLARTAMGFQFQSVAAAGATIIDVLVIDYALLGTLIGLYMLPGIVVALPGGFLIERYGEKSIAVIGLVLMAAGGGLMAFADGSIAMFAGRLLTGVGAVLLNVVLTKMTTDWFAGREIVTAMAILLASWPLGIGIALVSLGALAADAGLSAAMGLPAAICVVCALLVWSIYRDPPEPIASAAPASTGDSPEARITGREIWLISLAGLIWTTYNAGYIIVISFAPDYFVSKGLSIAGAGAIVSLVTWTLLPIIPVAGYLVEKLRRATAVMAVGFALCALFIALIPSSDTPLLVFVLMGLAFSLPPGLIMALPSELLRRRARAIGTGIFFTWYYAGMAALPVVAGAARDWSGAAAAPIYVGAVVMASSLIWLAAMRLGQKRAA